MKFNINKRTLWCTFLKPPTDSDIQEAANTMKGGKGYLFKSEDNSLEMYNKRRLNEHEAKGKTFIKKILAND